MQFRIGHGYDIHQLRSGGKLYIAGVAVADHLSAEAHSDGDVAIHALVDAILGGIAQGDIGEHFPNTDLRWKDARSERFLQHAVQLAAADGWQVVNVDITLLAERPKLKPFKQAMVSELSKHLGGVAINIKAGTNEGCDAIGRGEAVAAHAVVLLAKSG